MEFDEDRGSQAEINRYHSVSRRLSQYGITLDQYNAMRAKQGGRCAICQTTTPGSGRAMWAIDHNHACCPGKGSCGKCVRGLLCLNCNAGLGMFKDSPGALIAAAAYIRSSNPD